MSYTPTLLNLSQTLYSPTSKLATLQTMPILSTNSEFTQVLQHNFSSSIFLTVLKITSVSAILSGVYMIASSIVNRV